MSGLTDIRNYTPFFTFKNGDVRCTNFQFRGLIYTLVTTVGLNAKTNPYSVCFSARIPDIFYFEANFPLTAVNCLNPFEFHDWLFDKDSEMLHTEIYFGKGISEEEAEEALVLAKLQCK